MRRTLYRVFIVITLTLGLAAGISPAQAQSHTRTEIETLAQYYANYYGVPLELVRRVINRESTFNPSARNGPYYGLMQILPATARTMGYRGAPEGLLNGETNLIYAVKYLRGAWLLANGSHDRAVQLYAAGYYYVARDAGMLEATGLRPGPGTIATPAPIGAQTAVAARAPEPQPRPAGQRRTLMSLFSNDQPEQVAAPSGAVTAPAVAPEIAVAAVVAEEEPVIAIALGVLPPRRPATLDATPIEIAPVVTVAAIAPDDAEADAPATAGQALAAIAAASAPEAADPARAALERNLEWASAYAELRPAFSVDDEDDLLEATFAMFDPVQSMIAQSDLAAGADGFLPPSRPDDL